MATVIQITPKMNGTLTLPNNVSVPITNGVAIADIAPKMVLKITHADSANFPGSCSAEVPEKFEVPFPIGLPDEWAKKIEAIEKKKNRKSFTGQIKDQRMLLTYAGVAILILGAIAVIYANLGSGGVTSVFTITAIGGFLTLMHVASMNAAAIMDALRRQQFNDWRVICLEMFLVNWLCGWPYFQGFMNYVTLGRISPDQLIFGGFLLTIWQIQQFARMGGRDLTSPAVFMATNAFLIKWVHFGAIGAFLKLPISEDSLQMLLFGSALLLIAIDTYKPADGGLARTPTLVVTAIGLAFYIIPKALLTSRGYNVPEELYFALAIGPTFIIAAIGSERSSKDVENKEGSYRAFANVLERMWRENQFDAVVLVPILLYIGLRFGWLT